MKSLRSPLAVAAAALAAVPPAIAQPLSIAPPAAPAEAARDSGPAARAEIPPPGPLPSNLAVAGPEAMAPAAPAEPAPEAPSAVSPAAPAPVVAEEPRVAPAPTASVTVGLRENYTRLAFRFAGPTTVAPQLNGNRLDLRFSRAADLDMAELRANPPRYVREARRVGAPGGPLRVQLTIDPGVRQRHFVDGDRVVIDLLAPDASAQRVAAETPAGEAPPPAPERRPVSGTARAEVVEEADATRIAVTWPAPARAAAFRRGEAIWLLFDAAGRIETSGVARVGRRHRDLQVVQGEGVIGLRLPAPPDVQVSASATDNTWTFTLSSRAASQRAAPLRRETLADGRARLLADFGRDGNVRWIRDPEIGDRIGAALIGGPAKGVDVRRATVEAAVLPAAHGAAIEMRADDVSAVFADGVLIVSRAEGLLAEQRAATGAHAASLAAALHEDEAAGAAPPAPAESLEHVRERIDELTRRAAEEGVREGAPVEARMALARYLLANDFAAEALGALRMVAINQGELAEIDPEFRLMRGAANAMMGRIAAAQPDLTASALANNPAAALWRGYAHYQQHEWSAARRELERGVAGLEQQTDGWRARFQLALAAAALELNDAAAADAAASAAFVQAREPALRLQARLVQARVMAARGETQEALALLDELSSAGDEEAAVGASVAAVALRRSSGVMRAVDAVEPLEALRFRWRGNSTELAVVGLLGECYSELGRWRDALATMRIAADRFPADPAARQLRADMSTLFERLFLDGEADRLEPIQALGLFYEFSDLTPVGPSGDRIVRLLAGRLVHVDLLEQAAQLLQHQVDERLEGAARSQVAADLAAIYLMDGKPDRALTTLASTRQPNMPQLVQADRRILEARALLDLGRLDAAAELVERDRSEDAQRVRADAAWRARDWERAAVELRALLALRDRSQPLDAHGRQAVLRAGIALTLSGNEEGVRALYREHAGDLAGTEHADAFEIVAAGVHADGSALRDVARAVARSDVLDRFLQRQRARLTEEAARSAANAANAAPAPAAPGAPAAPPPQAALPAQRPGA